MRLPQRTIEERDAQIWRYRQQGMSFRQIAAQMSIAPSTAYEGYNRELRRVARTTEANPQAVAVSMLSKFDTLESILWPQARPHKIKLPPDENGEIQEIEVPPNMDAIDRLMKIQTQRAKLLGLEKDVVQIETTQSRPAVNTEIEAGKGSTSEKEAKELALDLIKYGVLDGKVAKMIESALKDEDIIDVEVIEDSEDLLQLNPVRAEESTQIAPEWEDEEETQDGWWVAEEIHEHQADLLDKLEEDPKE